MLSQASAPLPLSSPPGRITEDFSRLASSRLLRREPWLSTTGVREASKEAREGCRGEAREVRVDRPYV